MMDEDREVIDGREQLRTKADRAYLEYIRLMSLPECLGEDAKLRDGSFGKAELDAHRNAHIWLGKHQAYADAALIAGKPGASVGQAAGVPGPVDGAHSAKVGSIPAPGPLSADERVVAYIKDDIVHREMFTARDTVFGRRPDFIALTESLKSLVARLSALTGGRG